jgi:starch synthase
MSDALKILLVSSEVMPFAKTGGLADVAGSLPKALRTQGHDVRVVLPRYKQIERGKYVTDFPVDMQNGKEAAIIREGEIGAKEEGIETTLPVYFIDNYRYFYREGIYGYWDEAERFAFFCKAVLEMLPRINFQPDIIHCNDWQSGPIPLLLKVKYNANPFYDRMATLFTIHNLRYQGNFAREALHYLGLGDEFYHPEELEFYGYVSYMKAGLLYSDILNTVSRTYAEEIKGPELGERFDGLLRKRSRDLYGIVNGINFHEFNPATDHKLYRNYDSNDIQGKKKNKEKLQEEMELPKRDVPLLGIISRLVSQKGFDLVAGMVDDLMEQDVQLIILGTGEEYFESLLKRMKEKHPDKVGLYLGFNADLAKRIYAGSDIFLMPSRYEPCGLGQLISLRYGTIPVVRHTGGLADTIIDCSASKDSGNGFAFREYSSKALASAVIRALKVYNEEPGEWENLVRRAMEIDNSWARSAKEYKDIYDIAIGKASRRAKMIS